MNAREGQAPALRPPLQTQRQVREDLNVYRTEAQQAEKVREDLNRYSHPGADCF